MMVVNFTDFKFKINLEQFKVKFKSYKNICKDESIVIHASGRTDAKVHGRRQVFHFDTLRKCLKNNGKGLLITFT